MKIGRKVNKIMDNLKEGRQRQVKPPVLYNEGN